MTDRFKQALLAENLPFVRLQGEPDERFNTAVEAVQSLIRMHDRHSGILI